MSDTDSCPHLRCFAPASTCALGHVHLPNCPDWKGAEARVPEANAADDILLPWSGNALGLSDLSFVTGRAKPIVVCVAGPESAGKTTLLASWYLLLGRGHLTGPSLGFGGSFSLEGWEAVAAALRWAPGHQPAFPPHTTSRGNRAPGLLHLAFRGGDGHLRDFLFADAPGEWFQRWAVDGHAEDAEGARWLARHADVFLIAADRQALAGPRLGYARNAFQLLVARVAAERRGRPAALVWTKGDVDVGDEMEARIQQTVNSAMPDAAEFSVSVHSDDGADIGLGLKELFAWVVGTRRPGILLPPGSQSSSDPLFIVGRR